MTLAAQLEPVACYLLSQVFDRRLLGRDEYFRELPADRFEPDQLGYWSERVLLVNAAPGDSAALLTKEFIDRCPEALRALVSMPFPLTATSLRIGGKRTLATELFGRRPEPCRGIGDVPVADNHIHTGLAYDRRSLLAAMVVRPEPIVDRTAAEGGLPTGQTALAMALRWSLWLLSTLCEQGGWHTPTYVAGPGGMATAWSWVRDGTFWSRMRDIVERNLTPLQAEDVRETFLHQVYEAQWTQLDDRILTRALQRWQTSPETAPPDLIDSLADLGVGGAIRDEHYLTATGQDWRYTFALNTVRAAVRLFWEVPSLPAEGFALFQSQTACASDLRKTILAGFERDLPNAGETFTIASSLQQASRRYPAPYTFSGLELRREVDPLLPDEMRLDILDGILKRWRAADALLSDGTLSFCSPLSLQRPRGGWLASVSDTARHDAPVTRWQQVVYAAQAVASIDTVRAEMGADLFDSAVGAIDVSGVELGHATWPYVAALNWLLERGGRLDFTAHAGESFDDGFTGLRTIGQLFLGPHAPARIGHASALSDRMRRKVAGQHPRRGIHDPNRQRIDDLLQNLCYFLTVVDAIPEVADGVDAAREALTALVRPDVGRAVGVDDWVEAFRLLHQPEFLGWAFQSGAEQRSRWQENVAAMSWAAKCDLTGPTRVAAEVFTWGRVVSRDDAGSLPRVFVTGLSEEDDERYAAVLRPWERAVARHLRDLVATQGVEIECCPTSNLALAGIHDYEDHQLWDFADRGDVIFSINSDDPLVFGGFAGDELAILEACFGGGSPEHDALATALRRTGGLRRRLPCESTLRGAVTATVDRLLRDS